jgi:DNA-directed RNA polymerase subunit RPC12/RpoP
MHTTPCPHCKQTLFRSGALNNPKLRTDDHGDRYVVCRHCHRRVRLVQTGGGLATFDITDD